MKSEDDLVSKSRKIVGICYHYTSDNDFAMIKDMGVKWMRMRVPFPWEDKMFGKPSQPYLIAKERIETAHKAGINIMTVSPGLGAYRFDPEKKLSCWQPSWPGFAGEKGTESFFDNVRLTTKFLCEDLGEYISDYWQNMNEIDIPVFSKDYLPEVSTGTARASADGIVEANPKAVCGINLANSLSRNALVIADMAYKPGHKFGYIGDDQYFGSWQCYDVDKWEEIINMLYYRYGLPVLANEWGYSSGGKVTEKRPAEKDVPEGWMDVCAANSWFYKSEEEQGGVHTEDVQAEYLRKGLKIFAENPHCLGSFMFCWRDAKICYHCGKAECPAECFWGVVDQNLKPKKAYYAVKRAIEEYY